MSSRNYEFVAAIAREGSFSGAARKLYISQPALSAAIKKLEAELHGVPLFDRSVTPVALTKAGEFYLEKAEQVDRLEREIDDYFASVAGKKSGTLNIGAASFFCTYLLPELLRRYRTVNPDCGIHMREVSAEQSETLLKRGEADLIMDVEQMDPEVFESVRLYREYLLVAVPASFPVNDKLKAYRITREQIIDRSFTEPGTPELDLRELQKEPFLLLKKHNDMYRRAMEMCRRAGFVPKTELYLDQMLTAYNIARNSQNGVTFFRDTILRYTEPTERLCYYLPKDRLSERDILLSWKKTPGLTSLGEDFVKFLMLSLKL